MKHATLTVCIGELLLANLGDVSLNFLESSWKKKKNYNTIFAFFIRQNGWVRRVNDPFWARVGGGKNIDNSHFNYFAGMLVGCTTVLYYRMYPLIRHLTLLIGAVWKKTSVRFNILYWNVVKRDLAV